MPDVLSYVLDQARRGERLEEVAFAELLSTVPGTAWPDATQTTYRMVTRLPTYTSANACYSPDLVTEPTTDYGSRLLGALRDARRSLKPSSGESLVDQHAIALATIAAAPGIYAAHFLGGVLTALEHTIVAAGRLALQALEITANIVVCTLDDVEVELWLSVQAWLSGGEEPEWPTGSLECALYQTQARQTFDGLVARARQLDTLANDPAALVDAGVAVTADLYEVLVAFRLGDRYAEAVRDPAQLGALVGVVTGELAIFLVPWSRSARAGRVAGVEAATTAAAEKLAAADLHTVAATALSQARQASAAGRASGLTPATAGAEATILDATQAAGAKAQAILANADLSHLESFGRNAGIGLTRLITDTPTASLVQALTRSMEVVGASTQILVRRVQPYRDLRKSLSAVNASQRLIIGADAAAIRGLAKREAANLALLQQEDTLLEAAHLIDARFIGAKAPTAVGADLDAAGLANPQTAPAFAALRATHRTSIERLRSLGAPLPDVTGETITTSVMSALPIKQSRQGALLVVDDTTRAWEVVAAHYRVYASSPVVRHPAWDAIQEQLFSIQKVLLSEVRTTDPERFARIRDMWSEFASWLKEHPFP